jgi:two-component system, cell cycle sensor histidine kinase and response regulator CckA
MQLQSKKHYWFLILIFSLLSLVTATAGYFSYEHEKTFLKKERWDQLNVIADLKANQIDTCRKELIQEGEVISKTPVISRHVQQWWHNPRGAYPKQEILGYLTSRQKHQQYHGVHLLDTQLKVQLSIPPEEEVLGPDARALAEQAMREKKVILSDLYRSQISGVTRLSLLAPILIEEKGRGTHPIGAFLIRVDPYQFLYPLVQRPTSSRSAETVLVRRDGDEVVFLSELCHQKNTVLTLRCPLITGQLPAARAVSGEDRNMEGTDYRGVPVLAAMRQIPNSPWFLVCKVDLEEIYGPVRQRAWFTGTVIFLLITGAGLITGLLWRYQDFQFRKKQYGAELERLALAQHLDYLSKYANDIILLTDQDSKIVEANDRAVEYYGYTRDELLQLTLEELRSPEKRSYIDMETLKAQGENGIVVETEHRRKDEMTFLVESSFRIIEVEGRTYCQNIIRDITERKRAEKALRESEERYRSITQAVTDYIYTVRIESGCPVKTIHGPTCVAVTGYTSEEFAADPYLWFRMVDEDDRELVLEQTRKLLEGQGHPSFEHRIIRKDGVKRWISNTSALHFDEQGKLISYDGLIQDITERKQAEETVREKQSSLAEAQRIAHIGNWDWDIVRNQLTWSDEIYRIFGLEPKEFDATYEAFLNQVHPEDRDYVKRMVDEAMYENKPYDIDHRILLPDGSERIVHEQAEVIYDKTGKAIRMVGTVQEITEHKKAEQEKKSLEEQLYQSQKLEAIGRLAGGVAHDFNNLLTVIGGYCEVVMLKLKENSPLKEHIEEIKRAADRATSLTRQLLAFSRRQILDVKVFDLNGILKDLTKMLGRMIGEDVELVINLSESLGQVKTDPGQIEQVILNLAVNARDAMPDGGKLLIETNNVELDDAYAHSHIGTKPGRYVMFSLSDTGVGIPPEVKERIFEPFFTTKEKGKGTGLGLSTVYGIVKQSEGDIWVYSEPGRGTTFKIYLPRMDEAAPVQEEKVLRPEIPTGEETVLLVEDDKDVRELAGTFLKEQGYTVFTAQRGSEAIEICEKYPGSIHLMVTDMVMPGMSGTELVKKLSPLHPGLKILYMSGYPDKTIVHQSELDAIVPFLQKPFDLCTFAIRIREALGT